MPTFPTLSCKPAYPLNPDGTKEDATVKSPYEGGYEQTRPRFTRVRRRWGLKYPKMSAADKQTLESFEGTVHGGADSFTWTHPVTSTSYTVRFEGTINYSNVHYNKYDVEFVLKEV